MEFVPQRLEGVVLVKPDVRSDERGFFLETYHEPKYRDGGIPLPFVQDNQSYSIRHTLRGLHAQVGHPQGKLVRAILGEIFDVAVDARPGSSTFGQWVGAFLDSENHHQLYVPPGYIHGFEVLSDGAHVQYKCTDIYYPGDEITVAWNDPDIGIDWNVKDPVLNDRDRDAKGLREQLPLLRW